MRVYNHDIVLADVPNEISISFSVYGCTQNCKNCYWKGLVDNAPTQLLDVDRYRDILSSYSMFASCVLFYGGEWTNELAEYLRIAREEYKLKTCLFTGVSKLSLLPDNIIANLDYCKFGPYIEKLGGLNSENTNQRFIRMSDKMDLTSLFWKFQV